MSKIKAVLFDYDGTLMDTNNIIVESWQHTFRQLKREEPSVEEIYATFGEILHDTMARFFPDEDTERCVGIYRDFQVDCYEKLIEMFPGMEELVRSLKEKGYLTAIVTSRLPQTTAQGIEKFNLLSEFDEIITCADTDKHKPDPAPAQLAIEKLGVRPEECLMVGDTIYDILCGKRAGAQTALVSWSAALHGGKSSELSGEAKPDFIAETAADILRIIEETK